MSKIYENYVRCFNTQSDINQHLPTLRKYADLSNVVVEFGVRMVTSSWAFLVSTAKEVYSYDINYNDNIKQAEEICKQENRFWKFTLDSSLTADISNKNVDTIFIDTFHTYSQLKNELLLHGNIAKKYLIFHDTYSYGRISENNSNKGLLDAIEEFLNFNTHWKIKEHFQYNNGLMILERIG